MNIILKEKREPEITFMNIGDRVRNPSRPGVTLTSQEVEDILYDIDMMQTYCNNDPHADAIFFYLQDIFNAVTKSYEV